MKKNGVIIILLIAIICGLILYIAYDKGVLKNKIELDNKNKSATIEEQEEKDTITNEETTNEAKPKDDFSDIIGEINREYLSKEDVINRYKDSENYEDHKNQYAITDIDGDNIDDILIHEANSVISFNVVVFKGTDKGYYQLGTPIEDGHISHMEIIKEEGKNYLTITYNHMGYEKISHYRITENGYEYKLVRSVDDSNYTTQNLKNTLKWLDF